MKRRMRSPAGVLLCLALGCATGGSWKPESTTAPDADLAAYASFGWHAAGDHPRAGDPPLSISDANVRNAIRAQLIEKGYREVEQDPDVRIRFATEAHSAEKASSPVRIGVGVGSWGGPVGGGVSTSVPVGREGVVTTQEIRLTIRVVEAKGNREVWVGSTTGSGDRGLDANAVEKAVAGLLAEFPERRK